MRTLPDIRPLLSPDATAAAAAVLRGGWGERQRFFEFAAGHDACHPVLAEIDGQVVGTGVGTANGRVGWIGAIWVDTRHRRRGLGRALTEAVIANLEGAGCTSLVLVASEEGRPLYERLGFAVQTAYVTVESAAAPFPADPAIRPFEATDLAGLIALDATATGEDRGHLLSLVAGPGSTRCLGDPGGGVRGFACRAPWSGAAAIAPDPADGVRLLEERRRTADPGHRVRAALLAENREGLERLATLGWREAWRAPRLVRGTPPDWLPTAIWGQFNLAVG